MAGTCECGNEPSGSIKCGEFLDYLRNGQLLKKDCAVWIESKCKLSYFQTDECAVCDLQGPDVKTQTNLITVFEHCHVTHNTLHVFIP